MRAYRDGANRDWYVEIDPWLIKQVAARTGVPLNRLLDDNMAVYTDLCRDPVKFVDVMFVLVGERAEKLGVTEEQFFRAHAGDALEAAYEAFREAFADFSPSHLRKLLLAAGEKAKVAVGKATDRALERLRRPDPEPKPDLEPKEAGPEPPATSSPSATGSPGSSGSAPEG